MKKNKLLSIWSFLIGIVLAIMIGLIEGAQIWAAPSWMTWIFLGAGAIIGLINISAKEGMPYLVAVLSLGLGTGILSTIPVIPPIIDGIFVRISEVAIPAALIVAIRTIVRLAK